MKPAIGDKEYPAWKIEADRCRAKYIEAKNTIMELSGADKPLWGCGTPMNPSDKSDMLKRARAVILFGDAHWRDYLSS